MAVSTTTDSSTAAPFGIYYGWPSAVNGSDGDVARAVGTFVSPGFPIVVLGDDTVLPHGDPNAMTIIHGIRAGGGEVYGYVAIAVHHIPAPLSLDEILRRLETWAALGASGVLLDCAGHDFGVSRARFAAVVAAAHAVGLRALVNAWNPHDVLSGDPPLREGDGYLGENTVLSRGVWREPAEYEPKLAAMLAYKRELGIKLFETATTSDVDDWASAWRRLVETLAPYDIDYVQLTDPMYSATTNVLLPPIHL